ncbi:PQQ-binding-like beta-propeller repeat protein [Gimesia sp.]|uniref:PQQ-binding-like beta-propeller repeat protein n=1 Tax=Gimesia sp. TaxID=2024833 RepID=UPI000C3735B9|nr:PQQ-binding-like beta-propeller repeat protein [Gimesia sp.]MAX36369.1 pyrrolo-quinoline quinone [Gimesia sp.]|tara:strand:+ start:487 stop:1752 length:1266 start_codon:yes stop_codon:yes gene_type:complete
MLSRFYFSLVIFLLGSFCSTVQAAELKATDWSQWRGPHRDGTVSDTALPESLSEQSLTQVWKIPLGPGYSGPLVTADRIFVTETIDQKTEVVRALNRKTGKQIWKQAWPGTISVPFFAKENGDWIRATPAYDGERLYVAGIRDLLVCLDATSGEILWRIDFVDKLNSPPPAFGFASSPLIVGDSLYVQAGGGLCKVDKLNGEIKWRTLEDGGGMFGSAFSSPYYATLNGVPQLIVQTRTTLAGVNPDDGTPLWKQDIPAFRGMNILTPTVHENSVFTSSYGGKSFLFTPGKTGEQSAPQETWTNRAQGYMSSPLIIEDHIYLHLRNQRLTCIDFKTGETRWTTTPYGKYWSMVTDGKKILALDQTGDLLLIQANPQKFELLDRRKVAEDSWAHIAVSGNEIFIRALDHLAVYRWKTSETGN